ncbi:4a-hydroxytetrahydrobiopterin dehydratase [Rhizobium sp. PP-F2F-G48]|uniref:4a-hydroxytetrahydrobiopterin dehydratase n=1 Tax=Rhizobium sp. PP-F2F-G48 TaxID=2135651 RepID=UPI00104EF365|nr:4a-hydroxytetrahydrobiopterin dehydratase [Rhizobium sp. PP-F2F-G48]TCM55015.1 4a-hydroxytetrahydrobiopterin dehydratase [Rhizobium sp. PP-F2F-G48]
MTTRDRLSPEDISIGLAGLPGWALSDDGLAIEKTYRFPSFVEAFGFMSQSALAAEKLDHHPEWFNVYNRVEVKLTTHSAKGVTALDLSLAARMEKAASAAKP